MKESVQQPATFEFELSGGALCLDFINTVGDRPRRQAEHLREYSDLLSWSRQAGLVDPQDADRIARRARETPRLAARVFSEAIDLRECLYRIFSALAAGDGPPAEDLEQLNAGLATSLVHLRVARSRAGFGWRWDDAQDAFDQMLWRVVHSAADLLTSREASRVRECASETCSWLFVDRSRGHRRRWCDMKTCGNRAKARRYYQRRKLRVSDRSQT